MHVHSDNRTVVSTSPKMKPTLPPRTNLDKAIISVTPKHTENMAKKDALKVPERQATPTENKQEQPAKQTPERAKEQSTDVPVNVASQIDIFTNTHNQCSHLYTTYWEKDLSFTQQASS